MRRRAREGENSAGRAGGAAKPLQDSPTPAGNPTAASALLRLEALSGRQEYREIAEDTLSFCRDCGALRALRGQLWAGAGAATEGSGAGGGGGRAEAARLEATAVARLW